MVEKLFLTKCAAKLLQSENDGEIMLYVYTVQYGKEGL